MFKVIKKNTDGEILEIILNSEKELLKHLDGMFTWTDHKLIAVIHL